MRRGPRSRSEGHSVSPPANCGLDAVVGTGLARDVLEQLIDELPLDLEEISRPPHFVPDTQPLARFIVESQQTGHQGALAGDEHGLPLIHIHEPTRPTQDT